MRIDFTSDLHLDFVLGHDGQHSPRRIEKILKAKMGFGSTTSDVLLIAGDLGHYNKQSIEFVRYMTDHHYKSVVFVHGNHDMYLVSKSQSSMYKDNSFNRLASLREDVNKLTNAYYLDGEIVEIDGVKIAGFYLALQPSIGFLVTAMIKRSSKFMMFNA